MSTQYTSGEWVYRAQGDANEWAIITVDNRWVISFRQNGELMDEEQVANARLLSASPKLLAAARLAYKILGEHRLAGMDQNPKGVMDILGSAILNAVGKI